jgi:hypothetical protein
VARFVVDLRAVPEAVRFARGLRAVPPEDDDRFDLEPLDLEALDFVEREPELLLGFFAAAIPTHY